MGLWLELRPARRIDEQLLHPLGERVILALPHHPVAYYHGWAWVVAAATWTLAVLATNAQVAALFPVFLLLARGGWLLLRTHQDWFVVTDMRIFRIQGVFNQRAAAMSLSRIVDFTMEQPLTGQMMGFGHFVFENAAQDQGLREIRHIRDVNAVNKTIQELVFQAGGGPAKHKRPVPVQPVQPIHPPRPRTDEDLDQTGEIPRVT
jgi:hypothetical protein